jgi:serine/threonine-protein kinase
MASVWKATHLAFDEIRALKVILPELVTDENFVKRFKQEALNTFKLKHPNVVRVDDIDEAEDGRPFIVMEFIAGQSLKHIIRDTGPLRAARTCALIKQAASALDAAHRIGMIHRDIKPDNIQVINTPEGEVVKVLDFGIAKVKEAHMGDGGGMTLTGTGVVIGTPQYMSPEQAIGKRGDELDGRSDLYSLGVVMYQMLTADLPFKADTTMEMLLAHLQKPPAPIRTLHPELNIPEPIAALTMRLLEKSPNMRPASAAALITEIERAEAEMAGIMAPRLTPPDDVPLGARTAVALGAVDTAGPFPSHRHSESHSALPQPPEVGPFVAPAPQPQSESRWGLWVGLIVLVLGLGGGGLYLFRRPAAPTVQEQPASPPATSGQPVEKPAETPPATQIDSTRPANTPPAPVNTPPETTTTPVQQISSHAKTSVAHTRESFRPAQRTTKPSVQTTREAVKEMPPTQPTPSPVDLKAIKTAITAAITEGDVMQNKGEYDDALAAYKSALKLDPNNEELRKKFDKAMSSCQSERRVLQRDLKCAP